MMFSFKAEVDGLMLTLTADRIYRSKLSERYKLTITGTNYQLIVQTNRPAIENGKKETAIQWHIAEGNVADKTKLGNLYQQLEKAIASQPSSFQGTLNFIDHF